jgi:hypothetical protein
MDEVQPPLFETALAKTQQDAETALRAAEKVVSALKGMQKAARVGDVRKLRAAPESIRQGVAVLDEEVARLATSWDFDEESYLRDGGYVAELLNEAQRQGLRISLQDDRLYCYPMLISVSPADRALKIDKKLERSLRPSALVALLRARQGRQPRFRSAPFLEALRTAYALAVEQRSKHRHFGSVVPLRELYELLTLFPGQSREYSLPEFARDIYLLDLAGENTTRDGSRVEFHASTGTKSERGVLSLVTETGAEKRYYGISFSGRRD